VRTENARNHNGQQHVLNIRRSQFASKAEMADLQDALSQNEYWGNSFGNDLSPVRRSAISAGYVCLIDCGINKFT
jgi:hypothetical protein